jgi:hypothetical protein
MKMPPNPYDDIVDTLEDAIICELWVRHTEKLLRPRMDDKREILKS